MSPVCAGLFLEKQCVDGGPGRDAQLSTRECSPDLKRLAFIPSYSAFYSSRMAALYRDSRSKLPGALHPSLDAFEGAVSSISMPVLQAMQLRSEQLLTTLDRKVSPPTLARHTDPDSLCCLDAAAHGRGSAWHACDCAQSLHLQALLSLCSVAADTRGLTLMWC